MINIVGLAKQTDRAKIIHMSNLIKRILQNEELSTSIRRWNLEVWEELRLRIIDADSLKGWPT